MKEEMVILFVEDDDGHARLIEKNLRRAGIRNEMLRFQDGQEILDFLFRRGEDIRIPKLDGVEVLRQIKQDDELRKIPVIMLTTTDDPREVDACHSLGCSHYIVKPVEYEEFARVLGQLGLFLKIVQLPRINGVE